MLAIDGTSGDESAGLQKETNWTASRSTERVNHGNWHSINGACEILGVDQSTLRRWSDKGWVPVFRTPGGHRRYNEQDLVAFLDSDSSGQRRVNPGHLAAMTREEFDRRNGAVRAGHLLDLAQSNGHESDLSETCERMIDASVLYASGGGDADHLVAEARTLARTFGRCTSRAGLEASEAIEAFLRFKRLMLDALGRYLEQQHLSTRRCCRAFSRLNAYFDVMLTSLIEAHEVHSKG